MVPPPGSGWPSAPLPPFVGPVNWHQWFAASAAAQEKQNAAAAAAAAVAEAAAADDNDVGSGGRASGRSSVTPGAGRRAGSSSALLRRPAAATQGARSGEPVPINDNALNLLEAELRHEVQFVDATPSSVHNTLLGAMENRQVAKLVGQYLSRYAGQKKPRGRTNAAKVALVVELLQA